jgi:hypothetical protein
LAQPAIAIVAADWDGDGKSDVAVLDSSGVSIFLSDGSGNLRAGPTYLVSRPVSIAAADFNRDGHIDLALTQADGTVSILLGNGDGTFQSLSFAVNGNPQGLAIGDFNRDGVPDLAISKVSSNGAINGGSIAILFGNGDGTFRPPATITIPSTPSALLAVDLDADGHLDLIIATSDSLGSVLIFRGNGDGTFQSPQDLSTSSNPLARARNVLAADLNGDGALDLIVVNNIAEDSGVTTEISVLLASANGFWRSPVIYRTGITPAIVANTPARFLLVDLDADGHPDLVSFGDQVSAQFGKADGTFEPPISYLAQAMTGVALDLDGDGLLDLVGVGRTMTILHNSPSVSLTASNTRFSSRQLHTTSQPLSATLRNLGHVPLKVSGVQLTGDFSQTNDCGSQLVAGSECSIAVTFLPEAPGTRTGTLSVSDASGHSAATLAFTGEGTATGPAVMLSPPSLTFTGTRVATQTTQTAQLTNTGTAPLSIASVGVTGAGQFSVANNCGTSLTAGASCTLSITFSPSFPETQTGAVSITDDAPASPQTLPLTGSGESLAFSKTSLNFQPVVVGQMGASLQSVTLFNVGPGAVTFTAIALTGLNASDFQWLPNSGPQLSCPLPGVLRAGDHCFLSFSFTPSASGPRSATLSVSDDRDPFPVALPITGTGKPRGPIVSFSVPSLSFGSVPEGSSKDQILNMTNSGDTPLSISSVATTAQFSQSNNCGSTLAAGATCAFTVTFKPVSDGLQSGSLTVTDNAPGSPQSVALSGTGQNVVFSKTSLVFPATPVGQTSATRSVSLFSLSGNPIVISSLSGPNAGDFQVVSMSCGSFGLPVQVRHGDPCTIQLVFTPSAKGPRSGQFIFTNDGGTVPVAVLPLSANGL